jgi:hypothetical protein
VLYELEVRDAPAGVEAGADLGTVSVRRRDPDTGAVQEVSSRLDGAMIADRTPENAPRFFLAACAAEFAEILRGSGTDRDARLAEVETVLTQVRRQLPRDAAVRELLETVRRAREPGPER